jgi:crotonobetainyl-CoA:carnitine CoA-transferase CaiB-like acyl-CoA transferase
VTPYRHACDTTPVEHRPVGAIGTGPRPPSPKPGPKPIDVVELTTMWAGPLAGALLARYAHASVTRVQAPKRPEPRRYADLAEGKRTIELDLTDPGHNNTLLDILSRARVLISNFSRRVMPNLGLAPAMLVERFAQLLVVTMPAFPAASAEQDWIAYGTGVHAASGLGDPAYDPTEEADGFWSPSISYPDPITGLVAFARILQAVADGETGHLELSMHHAIGPLRGGA